MDDRSLTGYKKISDWAKAILVRLDEWDSQYGGIASKEDRCSSRLLRHHCNCVYEGGKFQTYLMPLNRLEGPHIELPQLIAYMKFDTVEDYRKYHARLLAVPTALKQVTELLKEGIQNKILPPAVGLESVGEQLESAITSLNKGVGGRESPLWRPCPRSSPQPTTDPNLIDKLEGEVSSVLLNQIKPAYEEFRSFVVDTYIPSIVKLRGKSHACLDLPNGAKLYETCLKFHIGAVKTAQEVHDTGLKEVERITKEMRA
jgi:uncharacterized protein (DUF885 family)